ncbi:hypothetical protein MPH_01022 [Macrophomina phaseolina MS6]|uniref:Uncharacterized protein n=1 Tax=Macrophomina phaseolina (strain MS6) TaxID=1126212 RepID=K2SGT4_MACPH|nr:hypothetical protein MPH_01022 [Macrophomina phaseolina MS6]
MSTRMPRVPVRKNLPSERAEAEAMAAAVEAWACCFVRASAFLVWGRPPAAALLVLVVGVGELGLEVAGRVCFPAGGVEAEEFGAVVGREFSKVVEMLLAERVDGLAVSRLVVDVAFSWREVAEEVVGEPVRKERDRERLYSLIGLRKMPPAASAIPVAVEIDAEPTAVRGSHRRLSMYTGFVLFLQRYGLAFEENGRARARRNSQFEIFPGKFSFLGKNICCFS